jgi:hypothetical protein
MHSAPVFNTTSSEPLSVAIDFNHEGISDLAVADFGSDQISVLPGNGDGTFQSARDPR